MNRKTIRAIAGFALAPLAFEMIPHSSDKKCALAADITTRLCGPDGHFTTVPANVHIPYPEHETRTVRPIHGLASGSSSTTISSGVMTAAGVGAMTAAGASVASWLGSRE